MKSMEFTIDGISPIHFAPWNGVKVSAQITVMEETMCVRIELPPPACSFLERLQQEFTTLVPNLSEQSQEILWFMLTTDEGWATHQDLIDDVWKGEDKEPGAVRKAVCDLNASLKSLNFGYAVRSRNRIYYLVPATR